MASVNGGHHPDLSGRDGGAALTRLYDDHAEDLHRYLARRLDPATARVPGLATAPVHGIRPGQPVWTSTRTEAIVHALGQQP